MAKINYNEKMVPQTTLATIMLVPLLFSTTSDTPLPSTNYPIHYPTDSSLRANFDLDNEYYKSKEASEDKKQFLILRNFVTKLANNMKDLEPEFAQAINEDFWEMYESI